MLRGSDLDFISDFSDCINHLYIKCIYILYIITTLDTIIVTYYLIS